ncbi:phenylalanine 4-monooxygenase [Parendozoicomonas haliclonae]|uniref:Phenylalanine-4-hydroxylase n=1 Tax=Parendozoicomonas haliclonae TaxID=1960125 RepID=A0A1X7AJ92_9GAMM|nr:phenylalanine 4-monooxygenase [Parendozoicomonas haliclonae]SMA46312.1 Phenylalanine-4-hydroxylase [Parendozoicomonas haliclonae]
MKESTYKAREPDENGVIDYPEAEHEMWSKLIHRQLDLMPEHACQEFLDGVEQLNLPHDRIPQLAELNSKLDKATGWQVERVPALIDFDRFFTLLSEKKFPVATFIRRPEDMDYLKEPDLFHEVFGHCPLLTNPDFAEFTHTYGKLGKKADHQQRVFLARLYWFTVEFGLINTPQGLRIYGGGILSSPKETKWSIESIAPKREAFDPVLALRTPYRIDILQPLYYVIDRVGDLNHLAQQDIMLMIAEARQTGLLPPLFTSD